MSITPAFSPGPWITQGALVGSVRRWTFEDLYEQCSFHMAEKMPSSVSEGSRPMSCKTRSYSSGLRPCAATSPALILFRLAGLERLTDLRRALAFCGVFRAAAFLLVVGLWDAALRDVVLRDALAMGLLKCHCTAAPAIHRGGGSTASCSRHAGGLLNSVAIATAYIACLKFWRGQVRGGLSSADGGAGSGASPGGAGSTSTISMAAVNSSKFRLASVRSNDVEISRTRKSPMNNSPRMTKLALPWLVRFDSAMMAG